MLLLTSFDIWQPHQRSNSSDDLLNEISQRDLIAHPFHFLRKIRVDFQTAPREVISTIDRLQPDVTICCGMAESRHTLTVESNGKSQGSVLQTPIDLAALIKGTIATQISHDAGNFVCNHLYYSVLSHLRETQPDIICLFVHVPLLNEQNLDVVMRDFLTIVHRLNGEDVTDTIDQFRSYS
ncbi:MAG: peptidase C15 [Phormidesmis sp. CAN_BIN44]|nr:peptidase C15 [Phormidesmis sp. CAN_BIN44]